MLQCVAACSPDGDVTGAHVGTLGDMISEAFHAHKRREREARLKEAKETRKKWSTAAMGWEVVTSRFCGRTLPRYYLVPVGHSKIWRFKFKSTTISRFECAPLHPSRVYWPQQNGVNTNWGTLISTKYLNVCWLARWTKLILFGNFSAGECTCRYEHPSTYINQHTLASDVTYICTHVHQHITKVYMHIYLHMYINIYLRTTMNIHDHPNSNTHQHTYHIYAQDVRAEGSEPWGAAR